VPCSHTRRVLVGIRGSSDTLRTLPSSSDAQTSLSCVDWPSARRRCLALGRRLALLRDETVKKMPTDLVGHIYHPVDLTEPNSVTDEIDKWLGSLMKPEPSQRPRS
jgi:hypothetical protein